MKHEDKSLNKNKHLYGNEKKNCNVYNVEKKHTVRKETTK